MQTRTAHRQEILTDDSPQGNIPSHFLSLSLPTQPLSTPAQSHHSLHPQSALPRASYHLPLSPGTNIFQKMGKRIRGCRGRLASPLPPCPLFVKPEPNLHPRRCRPLVPHKCRPCRVELTIAFLPLCRNHSWKKVSTPVFPMKSRYASSTVDSELVAGKPITDLSFLLSVAESLERIRTDIIYTPALQPLPSPQKRREAYEAGALLPYPMYNPEGWFAYPTLTLYGVVNPDANPRHTKANCTVRILGMCRFAKKLTDL